MRTDWLKPAGFLGLALLLAGAGCKSNTPAPIVDVTSVPGGSSDPADANIASGVPTSTPRQPARVLGQRSQPVPQQASGEQYPQQQQYLAQPATQDQTQYAQQTGPAYDQAYEQDQAAVDAGQQALFAEQAPPPLPEYEQPELTEPGYEWTPGYWSYASQGYYWVPGAWVAPPYEGALWTPGYWGYVNSRYQFHHGFWGEHVGFYGGINYGHGYFGQGYRGGYWNGNHFFYNTQVNRVNTTVVRNTYIHNVTIVNNNRVSFNGPRGIEARPTGAEIAVYHERILPAMHVQVERQQAAATNRQQFFTENHGRPATVAATDHFAADRTPPPAIHITPAVIRAPEQRPVQDGRAGNFGRAEAVPAAAPRVDPGQQARKQQMQNAQRQQQAQQQNVQRQQEQENAQRQQQMQQQQQNVQRQDTQRQQQDTQRQQQAGHPQRVQPPVNRAPQNARPEVAPPIHPTPAPPAQVRQTPAPAAVAPRPETVPQPRAAPAPPARPAPAANPARAPRPAPAAAASAPHPTPAQRSAPPAKAPEPHEEHPH